MSTSQKAIPCALDTFSSGSFVEEFIVGEGVVVGSIVEDIVNQ